ncbi:MAG: cyclic nucleotide-binding domain-containing protein [Planctomycetales bacterium]|nr:cyclic nucleotide-binding domain-containing protein [Planctomycetales bacterium]
MDAAKMKGMLRELRFSADLPDSLLEQLAEEMQEVSIPAGSTVFREGAENHSLYLVIHGHFTLSMNVPGRGAVPILTVGEGEMFGWSSLLGEGKMTTSAVATEDSLCLVVEAAKLHELSEADAAFGYHLMRRMAGAVSSRLIATRLQLLDLFGDH